MSEHPTWPKTLDEAVERMLTWVPEEQWHSLLDEGVWGCQFTLGQVVRNQFGLWEGNEELAEDIRRPYPMPRLGLWHPDDLSARIVEAFYRRLLALTGRSTDLFDSWVSFARPGEGDRNASPKDEKPTQ